MSEIGDTVVKPGYSIRLYGPNNALIWERQLSGSSFDDHDSLFYLGEEIIEQLPVDAFDKMEDEDEKE